MHVQVKWKIEEKVNLTHSKNLSKTQKVTFIRFIHHTVYVFFPQISLHCSSLFILI